MKFAMAEIMAEKKSDLIDEPLSKEAIRASDNYS